MKTTIIIRGEDGSEQTISGYQYAVYMSTDDDLPSNPDTAIVNSNPLFMERVTDHMEKMIKLHTSEDSMVAGTVHGNSLGGIAFDPAATWVTEEAEISMQKLDGDLHEFVVKNKDGKVLGTITPAVLADMMLMVDDLNEGACPIEDEWEDGMGNTCTIHGWGTSEVD